MNPQSYLSSLHGHSIYSDGAASPTKLVQSAQAQGITYLALTDHNSVKGIQELYQAAKKTSVIPIAGIELMTDHGEIILIAPRPFKELKPFFAWLSKISPNPPLVPTLQQAIKELELLVIIPHPNFNSVGMKSLTIKELRTIDKLFSAKQKEHICVEIHNWASNFFTNFNTNRERRLETELTKLPFGLVSGSDYHEPWQIPAHSVEFNHQTPASYAAFIQTFKKRNFHLNPPLRITIPIYIKLFLSLVRAFWKVKILKKFHQDIQV